MNKYKAENALLRHKASKQRRQQLMKKRMRQKIPKLHSKKGMSLIELVVGITIIVIVFGSTLSAMTNGFTNTLYNAEVNKTAVEAGSVNELMMEAAIKKEFASGDDVRALFTNGQPNEDNTIHTAAQSVIPDMEYVIPEQFPKAGIKNQYTILIDVKTTTNRVPKSSSIRGIEIQTMVTSIKGTLMNRSFVAYTLQPQTTT